MDRRHFNSMLLAGGAAAATGTQADQAVAQGAPAAAGYLGFELMRLPEEYRKVFEQTYPRFSDGEYKRRQDAMAAKMAAAGLDYVLMVTNVWVGNANVWMTGWRGTAECLGTGAEPLDQEEELAGGNTPVAMTRPRPSP